MIQDFIPRLTSRESVEDKRKLREQLDREIAQFLANGGKIVQLESCLTSDGQATVRKFNQAVGFEQVWR